MLKFLSAGLIVISGLSKSFSVVDLKLLRLFFFLGGISVKHKTSEIQQLVYRVRDTLGQYNFPLYSTLYILHVPEIIIFVFVMNNYWYIHVHVCKTIMSSWHTL